VVSDVEVTCEPPAALDSSPHAPDASLFLGPDARATRTRVGAVCAPHSLAIRADVPAAQAAALLTRQNFVVVLTSDNEVCGILSAAEPPRRLALLDGADPEGAWSKPHETGGRFRVLHESATLSEAIDLMVHNHVRLVALTSDERRFVGFVSDLDVLRWASETRRASPR
jgi:predicted transcriptional regulator